MVEWRHLKREKPITDAKVAALETKAQALEEKVVLKDEIIAGKDQIIASKNQIIDSFRVSLDEALGRVAKLEKSQGGGWKWFSAGVAAGAVVTAAATGGN